MIEKFEISIVDIWSTIYSTCLKGFLEPVGKIEGKTVYKTFRGHYYMLTDSRYGEDYFI
ncbi:MAG: hypothetical protein ACLSUP_02765 [Blautia massiliensis (ex Durand et al. 2017)]|uniref:hypothetical protein n=1 Tax=Blautia massiliensis (ex Durand et al. 2017) TaxID=1737424 RepID=UPI003994E560